MYDSHTVDFHTIEEALAATTQASELIPVGLPVSGQRLVLLIINQLPGVAFLLKAEQRAMNGDSRVAFRLDDDRVSREFPVYTTRSRAHPGLKTTLEQICHENKIKLVFFGLAARWVQKLGHMNGVIVSDIIHHRAALSQRFTGQQIDKALAFISLDRSLNIGPQPDYHV